MIEVIADLFPYIVLLYLIDCIKYIHQYHLIFVSYTGIKYGLKKSGFHVTDLLPIGNTIISHNYPIVLTCKGLYTLELEIKNYELDLYREEDFIFISYQDIDVVQTDGKAVKINGKNYFKLPSPISALKISELIKELQELSPIKRLEKIRSFLSEESDLEKIINVRQSLNSKILYLKVLCSFLFINVFILVPAVLYTNFYLYFNVFFIISSMGAAYVLIFFMTYFVHRKMLFDEKAQRAYILLTLVFYPIAAIHVLSYFIKDIFVRFNFLAIAASTLPSREFIILARKELYKIEHSKCRINNDDWIEYWNLKKNHLICLIQEKGYSLKDFLSAPQKQDDMAVGYCPYCFGEFIKELKTCPDCGIPINKF